MASIAFGFLNGGGFAIASPVDFDMAIPHQFIRIPTQPEDWVYGNNKQADSAKSAAPVAPKASAPAKRKRVRASPKKQKSPSSKKPAAERSLAQKTSPRPALRSARKPTATPSVSRKGSLGPFPRRRSSIMKRMELRRLATLLTPQERKQEWRLPPRRHTTYKRVASAGSPSHLEGNRFAVLAKLLCSQRKELDRTGTLRMSTKRQPREQLQKQQQQQEQKQKKPLKPKRRSKGSRSPSPTSGPCKRSRVESVSVNVVVTAPNSPPRSPPRQTQPHQMITRSRAAAMPTPPTFHTLQAERRVDLSAIPRLSASPGPVPTVSSYMVEGGPEPISNEELSRRLFEMELENKRLR